jgi:hypothetical protein
VADQAVVDLVLPGQRHVLSLQRNAFFLDNGKNCIFRFGEQLQRTACFS